jgi:predicted O-methyltransferase YrrM
MAYHGYIPFVAHYAKLMFQETGSRIKILEIGVDTGISLFALNNNLSLLGTDFEYTGVDIKIQNHVKIISEDYMFFKLKNTSITLKEENSLFFLKDLISNSNEKFDIILIDGDHNYYTVSKECKFIESLMHKNTLLLFDDYTGNYENDDYFYADRESYKGNHLATQNKNLTSEKTGVKPAVDEFIKNNSLIGFKIIDGDPLVVLGRENTVFQKMGFNQEESQK